MTTGTRTRLVFRSTTLIAALLVASASCASQPPGAARTTATTPVADEYHLGVGDVVRVSVWKEEELDAAVPVAPDGRISLPLLGDVDAAGRSLGELRDALTQGYAAYVTSPAVSVVLQEIKSQRVFVTGEVKHPGVIELSHRMRLMQALAVAGGMTPYAKGNRVVVLRSNAGGQERLAVNVDAIVSGSRTAEDVLLLPGDTVIVP